MKNVKPNTALLRAIPFPALLIGSLLIGSAHAAPIVYPAKGQSTQKQQKDDGECYSWAKTNTGVDPAAVGVSSNTAAPTGPNGERLRGAARGALGGAAIGAIAGDAGKGAAIGAAAGTMRGGARIRQRESEQQAAAQQEAENTNSSLDTYQRAYAACMEGRGYTIK